MRFRDWSQYRRGRLVHGDNLAWHDGLVVETQSVKVVIDPVKLGRVGSGSRVLVSHAHSDHTRGFGFKGVKQSTNETREIHGALNARKVSNFQPIELNRKISVDDI